MTLTCVSYFNKRKDKKNELETGKKADKEKVY